MPLKDKASLPNCKIASNCILVEWEFSNVNEVYKKLTAIAGGLPRTILLEETDVYWHGVCRSFIFRFPDDLEILKLTKRGIIQVRSASRFGLGDLGVNKSRVDNLYKQLIGKN